MALHRLTDIDEDARQGVCGVCGPTRISRHSGAGYWRCQEKSNADMRRWRERNPELRRRHSAWSYLKITYGLTPEAYGALFIDQDYKCGICGASLLDRKVAVDHDHESGRLRGLLCNPCNGNEGWFRNNEAAILAWQGRG